MPPMNVFNQINPNPMPVWGNDLALNMMQYNPMLMNNMNIPPMMGQDFMGQMIPSMGQGVMGNIALNQGIPMNPSLIGNGPMMQDQMMNSFPNQMAPNVPI